MEKPVVVMRAMRFMALKTRWVILFIFLSACVDQINFNVPLTQSLIVAEGTIYDTPGPYTVRLSKSISINADSTYRDPMPGAKIKLYDDQGNEEDLTESSPGTYMTGGKIQGQVGHAYYINIVTENGQVYQSDPDTLNPVGEVQDIKYQFEARDITSGNISTKADVFHIYIDADAGTNNFVRWRYTGTFRVQTHPDLHLTFSDGYWLKTPLPCSGVIVTPALGGGDLTQVAPCTCCSCWVNLYEPEPHLSDQQYVVNHQFRNVPVGDVPVNSNTFTDKFMVLVEQMSLTENAYTFFNLIKAQKVGATSLFQPPSGKVIGNIKAVNALSPIAGIFWATSVKSKYIFIQKSDVPYTIPPDDFIRDSCLIYPNSSTEKPSFWQ
jgi:hypothetical protein